MVTHPSCPGGSDTLHPTVSRWVNEVAYEIQPHPEWSRKGSEVVTIDRLKRYLAPENEGTTIDETHPPGMAQNLSLPGNEFLETFTTLGKSETVTPKSEDEDGRSVANDDGAQQNMVNRNGVPQSPIHSVPPSRQPTPPLSPLSQPSITFCTT